MFRLLSLLSFVSLICFAQTIDSGHSVTLPKHVQLVKGFTSQPQVNPPWAQPSREPNRLAVAEERRCVHITVVPTPADVERIKVVPSPGTFNMPRMRTMPTCPPTR